MSTRKALIAAGRKSIEPSEAQLIEAGKLYLRDTIKKALETAGFDAVGFEVKLKNGEEFTVVSETNPRLDSIPASEVASVRPRSTASAGAKGSHKGIRYAFVTGV